MASKTEKLRFASLIRVSTEKQQQKGESLNTQAKQIKNAVASMNGVISATYAGQEHGTPGWERKQLDKLLTDARRHSKPFDAVIVCDPSRWSRDNVANETGLDTLRDNGIRFFVLGMEFDLFDPMHRFMLASQAGMNKLQSAIQKQKSMLNRIERAKTGKPTCGKLPFGRTFDKETGKWGIDPVKQKMVVDVAKRYLAGEKMSDLADEYDINHATLHKIIMRRCGTEWDMEFRADDLNVHEVVTITIPRLLPEATIKALRKRCAANRTYERGERTHTYLLSGFLFCEHCGYALSGTPNTKGTLYYRHSIASRYNDCPMAPYSAPAAPLEAVVLRHLFDCFGNPHAIERAVEQATPNHKRINEYRERLQGYVESLGKLRTGRDRILRLITKGTIREKDAENELGEINTKEKRLEQQIKRLEESIGNAPSAESIKAMAANIHAAFNGRNGKAKKEREYASPREAAKVRKINTNFMAMSDEEKRTLVKRVFSGETDDGRPMGVYIRLAKGEENRLRNKRWSFFIRGQLIKLAGMIPWQQSKIDEFFQYDSSVTTLPWH